MFFRTQQRQKTNYSSSSFSSKTNTRYEGKGRAVGKKDRAAEMESLKRSLKAAADSRQSTEELIEKKERALNELQATIQDAQQ